MLAVGRALARHPTLLLLDELSLGLAPVIVEGLLPVVREYAEESGCGVVLVEQHIELALTIADRGYVLSHGEIVLQGRAEELRANHELLISSYFGEHADLFAGKPPMTVRGRTPTPNYEKLRAAIVRGEIAPNSRLVESDVVTSFDMSRAAVRNALIRLEQEGLVVREPHRGARVRQVTRPRGDRDPPGARRARGARRPPDRGADRRGRRRAPAGAPGAAPRRSSSPATCSAPRTRTPTCTRRSSSCPGTAPPSA